MKPPRWTELLEAVRGASRNAPGDFGLGICRVATDSLKGMDAALSMLSNDGYTVIAHTGRRAVVAEEQQFTLGEGPSFEACRSDMPVLVPDLGARHRPEWSTFAAFARQIGYASAFSFPVRVGTARLGALTIYRTTIGNLVAHEYADGLILASLAADEMLRVDAMGDSEAPLFAAAGLANSSEIHQAAGMVAEQLNCTIVDALVRLRATAHTLEEPLSDVARKVLRRELSIEP